LAVSYQFDRCWLRHSKAGQVIIQAQAKSRWFLNYPSSHVFSRAVLSAGF
jgi:hypothetical protein